MRAVEVDMLDAPRPVAQRLMEELTALNLEDEAPATLAKARLCFVDFLSCAFAGARLPWARQVLEVSGRWPVAGGAGVIGFDKALVPAEAAFLNAVIAATSSRTDMHPASTTHAAAVIFPVVLALSAGREISGRDLIAAVIAGYETAGRFGRIVVDESFRRHRRATSVLGVLAGAAAGARLLRLEAEAAAHALALAADTAAGLMEWGHSGEVELYYQPANAARNAVMSVLLAEAGVRASATMIEGEAGFLAAFGGRERAETLLRRGQREIETVEIKPVPACVFVQAAAHAALELVQAHRPDPRTIDRIVVRTFADAIACPGCDNSGPIDSIQASRMSLQHTVASVLGRGTLDDDNFIDLRNPTVRALTDRVELRSSPDFTAAFPRSQGAAIDLTLVGGEFLSASLDEVPPFGEPSVVARFRRSAAALMNEERACAILEAIDRLPLSENVAPLTEAVFAASGGKP